MGKSKKGVSVCRCKRKRVYSVRFEWETKNRLRLRSVAYKLVCTRCGRLAGWYGSGAYKKAKGVYFHENRL